MKTLQYFFFVTLATVLMAADCSNKDSEFYNDVFVYSPNLANVTLENDVTNGQTIYVHAIVARFIPVTGQANMLDIYRTTGGATKLNFTYELEKESVDNEWNFVEMTNSQLVIDAGEAFAGEYVYGNALYNAITQIYEYHVGIKSLPPGNYRLSFGYNSTSTTDVEFRSESFDNNLFLNLKSAYSGLDGGGYYSFTIN